METEGPLSCSQLSITCSYAAFVSDSLTLTDILPWKWQQSNIFKTRYALWLNIDVMQWIITKKIRYIVAHC
jgi:hypothetical protein